MTSDILDGWIIFMILILLYFIPSAVAAYRKHHNDLAILMLNIFLGWTLVGWVAALVWACTADVDPAQHKKVFVL